MEWHSDRYYKEQYQKDRLKAFDALIDLALDGVISMDQAILGCKEVIETEKEL